MPNYSINTTRVTSPFLDGEYNVRSSAPNNLNIYSCLILNSEEQYHNS